MGWAVGEDRKRRRHIGYGVPAVCDYPTCNEEIDRGLSFACGGGSVGDVENCGLFFCGDHLEYLQLNDEGDAAWVCERCAVNEPPFPPSPDTREWINHVLTDGSWAEWRRLQPDWVSDMQASLNH